MAWKFPYTSLHEINLDWILEQVKKFADLVPPMSTAVETVESLSDEVSQAAADASSAVESATTAMETAAEALEVAEQAAQGTIADGAVTTEKLANNAVTSAKIADGTISGNDIAPGTIQTGNLSEGCVTSEKILDGTIAAADLGAGCVTNQKIADNSVSLDKLSDDVTDKLNLITSEASLFICDSYGTGTGGGLTTTPFCDIVANKLGLTLNTSYFKVARGGASFGANNGLPSDAGSGLNFADLLNYAVSIMTESQRNSIKNVMICGGINDYQYTYDAIAAGANSCATILRANFPNAIYRFACIGISLDTTIRTTYLQNTVSYLHDACTGANINFGICYTPMNYNKNTMFHTDGTHPTQVGQSALARYVFDFMRGLTNYIQGTTFEFNTPLGYGKLQIDASYLTFSFTPVQKIYDTAINIPATWTDLGAIDSDVIVGNTQANATSFIVTGSIRASGTWTNNAMIECKFVQTALTTVHLYARSVHNISGTSTYNPYSNVTNFLPAPACSFIPLKG